MAITRRLPVDPDVIAPDGSEVRVLAGTARGSGAHFRLPAGAVARAVRHRTIDEIWTVTAGRGRIALDGEEVALEPGVSVAIPCGTTFQFRSDGEAPLEIVAVSMPPWPGDDEAVLADGPWEPTVGS